MQEATLEVDSNIGAIEKLRAKTQHEEGEKRKKSELGHTSSGSK